jgi:hypothetical protein
MMSMGKGRLERFQRLRDVCKRIVDDPHSIDGDTKAKLATLKYASTLHDDPTQALEVLYHDQNEIGRLLRKAVEVVADHDDASDDPIKPPVVDHHISRLADLVAEGSGGKVDRAAALRWLLHHRDGIAMARTHKAAKESTMSTESLESILKDFGPVRLCKTIVERQRAPCGEHELVMSLSQHVGGDVAFSKLYESEEVVRRACSLAKAAEFAVFDIKPVVVSGTDVNPDDPSAALRAYEEIVRIGREKFPFLPADVQFARVLADKNYAALVAQAHSRPLPTTVYPMLHSSPDAAYAKSDPALNADSAYAALMVKAEAYRNAHPELSIAQCFEKIYTDRANIELAKRERIENTPRYG